MDKISLFERGVISASELQRFLKAGQSELLPTTKYPTETYCRSEMNNHGNNNSNYNNCTFIGTDGRRDPEPAKDSSGFATTGPIAHQRDIRSDGFGNPIQQEKSYYPPSGYDASMLHPPPSLSAPRRARQYRPRGLTNTEIWADVRLGSPGPFKIKIYSSGIDSENPLFVEMSVENKKVLLLAAGQDLIKGSKNARAISLDVSDDKALDEAVAKVDLVISLIPYTFHATVIKSAIRNKKHVVTTSYVSPAMLELNEDAKKAGITVMNEIGVDPVHQAGGKILGFYSFCGGLPAPEASDNPLGYKMSWSPRGVLLALRNTARIIKDGRHVEIQGKDLMGTAKPYYIYPAFAFVGYPNRDSTVYPEKYQIPEAKNVVRGTLRYQGFPEMIRTLVDIGFLSDEPKDFLSSAGSWKETTRKVVGASSSSEADLVEAIVSKTSFRDDEEKQQVVNGLRWMGLFSDEQITPSGNPLDTLCATLAKKMAYGPGERDMVMLQHKFEIENKDGSKETRTSTLVEYGDPAGYSAMARLVGVPCAVAVQQVLDGTISDKGILAPMTEEICAPLRKTLEEKYGIRMIEKTL
ncbi:Saccharopine dehydrogenase [NADP(+), L-glutamate-forming] [Ascosphaera aggregata]|nr:Saccharopine dehydrogenase [NADP(+), L-glutamate-forming] [Ascosphaera aggregata]